VNCTFLFPRRPVPLLFPFFPHPILRPTQPFLIFFKSLALHPPLPSLFLFLFPPFPLLPIFLSSPFPLSFSFPPPPPPPPHFAPSPPTHEGEGIANEPKGKVNELKEKNRSKKRVIRGLWDRLQAYFFPPSSPFPSLPPPPFFHTPGPTSAKHQPKELEIGKR